MRACPPSINGSLDQLVCEWVTAACASRKKLLQVPLNSKSQSPQITVKGIAQQAGVSQSSAYLRLNLARPIIDAMIAQNIVVPGHSTFACEWRRRLLCWYEGLSDAEKGVIPVYNNNIKKRGYLDDIKVLGGYRSAMLQHPLVRSTYTEIIDDLKRRGILKSEYVTARIERAEKSLAKAGHVKANVALDFRALREVTLSGCEDLVASSEDRPFRSLLHLFSAASLSTKSTKSNSSYFQAWRLMCECLKGYGYNGVEDIVSFLGAYTLLQFREFLESLVLDEKISTSHANALISCARITLKLGVHLPGLKFESFFAAAGFKARRHGTSYSPYSPRERRVIADAAEAEMVKIEGLIQPYQFSGAGCDPLNEDGSIRRLARTLDNARWIFENKLGRKLVGYQGRLSSDPYEYAFFQILHYCAVSIESVYESWGVLYQRDSNILAPYIIRLAQVTGINLSSLASLGVDDFVIKSEIGGRPYLRYWKERSTGEKLYFMDLFEADIAWLSTSQAKEVKRIYEQVLLLTAVIRSEAPKNIADKLFIFRSSHSRLFAEIRSIEQSSETLVLNVLKGFSQRHTLTSDSGEPLSLLVTRMRPSLVSELIENGVPLPQIQLMLGHKHIRTTINYLDRLNFNAVARAKLEHALQVIHASAVSSGGPSLAVSTDRAELGETIIFKTPLAACKNIMNPPEFVKNLKSYVPSRPCQLYNKCLSCDNVILLKSNLPDLFAMQRDYLLVLELVPAMETPYFDTIRENLFMLSRILSPQHSSFSSAVLDEANRLSEFVETSVLVDGIIL